MRIIFIPEGPEFLIFIAVLLVVIVGIAIYSWLRPAAWKKVLNDGRYQQALGVYARNLSDEELTRENRRQAIALAIEYLTTQHGIPREQAGDNLRQVVAVYDRDRSYELRHEGAAYEEEGTYDLALECYERAARWQEEHDPKDVEFLQRCVARVRGKVRS